LGFSISTVTDKCPVEYWFIKTKAWVFIQKMRAWLKVNEIRSFIKLGHFSKGECSRKGGQGGFTVRHFCKGYENLIKMPNSISANKCESSQRQINKGFGSSSWEFSKHLTNCLR